MASITFLHADGTSATAEAPDGMSVMRAAITSDVDGIIGECGGQAMCATCHVYIQGDPGLPPVGTDEDEMLECTAAAREANSRLGCQLKAGRDFESLTVRIPARQ